MRDFVALPVVLALMREQLAGYRGYPNTELGETNFAKRTQEVAISVHHVAAIFMSFDVQFPTVREIRETAQSLLPKFQPREKTYEEWRKECGDPKPFELDPPDKAAMHWQAIRDALYYVEGPGRFELKNILDDKKRRIDMGFWDSALHVDIRDWPEGVLQVRAEVDTYGWDDIMARATPYGQFPGKGKDHEMWRKLKQHFTAARGAWPGWNHVSWREIYSAMPQLGYPLTHDQQRMLSA